MDKFDGHIPSDFFLCHKPVVGRFVCFWVTVIVVACCVEGGSTTILPDNEIDINKDKFYHKNMKKTRIEK